MARRYEGNMMGERFLGNLKSREVHDLDMEDTSGEGCRIDDIIRAGNDQPFIYLVEAQCDGFEVCAKCLGVFDL